MLGPDRLAARLRGRYADKQPHQHTLPPGQHTLTLVRGNDVSGVDVVIRPRTEADTLPLDAPFVVEVVTVRGSTILPVGHVEAVRMSVDRGISSAESIDRRAEIVAAKRRNCLHSAQIWMVLRRAAVRDRDVPSQTLRVGEAHARLGATDEGTAENDRYVGVGRCR